MDSLTEINNDTRFEHFIDESLDIDMSACAPILNAGAASFFDEILNTATAPLASTVSRLPPQMITHDFLVRLSPVAPGKRASPALAAAAVQRCAPSATKTVRLFGLEQAGTPATMQNGGADAATAAATTIIKTETTNGGGGGSHAFLVPPGRNSLKVPAATMVQTTTKATAKAMAFNVVASTTTVPKTRTTAAAATPKKPAVIEFYCHQCDLRVKSHVEFEKHYRTSHVGAPTTYACSICPTKLFGNLQSYRTHVKRHGERHPCAVCTRKFLTAELLAEHGQTHTSELRLKCGHCQEEFDDFGNYCQHVRVHRRPTATKPVKWKCPVCGKLFKNRAGLNTHAKVHRDGTPIDPSSTDVTKVEAPSATTTPITARTPAITVTVVPVATQHQQQNKQQQPQQVQQQQQQQPQLNSLPKATTDKPPAPPAPLNTTVTPTKIAAAVVVLAFPCDVCDKSFGSRTQLLRHRDHHNERSFKCETCQKFYKTERDLKVHSLVHYEQRPHACTHCGKSFLSSSKLKQHSNVHTGERPFKCKYCDKDFTNFPNWLKHVRRSHKVDHKTGEQLEVLPNFLVREKKGSVASIAARAKKVAAAAAAAAASNNAPIVVKPKPTAAATRKSKAAQHPPPPTKAPPPSSGGGMTLITIKQEYTTVPDDSALDLHDTNATGPTATSTATASTTTTVCYQDEASLPLDLRGMSASIQLQQSIDVHDMHQMQLLIPSHDESFASIEDVPTESHMQQQHAAAARKTSPTALAAALSRTGGRKSAQTSPTSQVAGVMFTPKIKVEPGRFSFARTATADGHASTGTQSVSFLTLLGQTSSSTEPSSVANASGATTATGNGVGGSANNAGVKKALSPLGNVPRRHFGGVATSHMFATNVL